MGIPLPGVARLMADYSEAAFCRLRRNLFFPMVFKWGASILETMKQGVKILACILAGTSLCIADVPDVTDPAETEADAPASDNPYQSIVDRNVFGLKPPPPVQDVGATDKTPPPPIFLTGISSFAGKVAMMKSQPTAQKPGTPPKGEQFYMLREGQRDGELEVIRIDERAGTVRINYAGTESTLDFTNNGVKVALGAPAPGGAPGGVPRAPGVGGIPAPGTTARPGLALPMPMGRSLRTGTPSGAQSANQTGVSPTAYGYQNPSLAGGNLTVGGVATANPQTQVNPVNQLPVEQQLVLIEAERERTQQAVSIGAAPPIPPTPISQSTTPTVNQSQTTQNRSFPIRAPGLPTLPQ